MADGDICGADGLVGLLDRVAGGGPVGFDGDLTVLPQPSARDAAVLAFTGHSVVAADVDPAWVRSLVPVDDLSAPLNPPFLHALERRLGRRVNNIDMLAVATGWSEPPALDLAECPAGDHPRVRRALRYREDVRVWTVEGGLVVVGRGLAGRWEVGVEVDPAHRGRGLGRALAAAARHLVPAGEPLWAQIAPGNAASVRAFLASGFRPVGAEALLVRY